MELDISAHAIVRMYDRHISRDDIEAVLANPMRIFEDDDAVVYDGVVGNRIIRVIVRAGSDPLRIVSVYPRRR